MRLTLPMPPSANHYKKPRRQGGFYLTDEARAFLARVRRLASRCRPIEKGMVAVEYRFFRGERDGRLQRGDLANYEKVLSDALQGRAFRNDSQIRRMVLELHEDRAHPRVEVLVESWPKLLVEPLDLEPQAGRPPPRLFDLAWGAPRLTPSYQPPKGRR